MAWLKKATVPVDEPPDCPDCDEEMVLRTARKGPNAGSQFWGCPDFPACRGTRDLNVQGRRAVHITQPHSSTARGEPYVWVTWLAEVMAGDLRCQWKSWFRAHYQLAKSEANGPPELAAWIVDHTRMVDELRSDLAGRGRVELEQEVKLGFPTHNAVLAGKIDLLLTNDARLTVFECKTGRQRARDQIQLYLYMHMLERDPRYRGFDIRGVLSYPDRQIPTGGAPEGFSSNVEHFIGVVAGPEPAPRVPGNDCLWCPITASDCPDRLE